MLTKGMDIRSSLVNHVRHYNLLQLIEHASCMLLNELKVELQGKFEIPLQVLKNRAKDRKFMKQFYDGSLGLF